MSTAEDLETTLLASIDNAHELETLYQNNKKQFTSIIQGLYDKQDHHPAVGFWYARLFHKNEVIGLNYNKKTYIAAFILTIACWIPLKILISSKSEDVLFLKYLSPLLFSLSFSLFLSIKNFNFKNIIIPSIINASVFIFSILLPHENEFQSLNNSYYYSFILFWISVYFSFINSNNNKKADFSEFITATFEVVIWSTLLFIGIIILYAISLLLFEAVNLHIHNFYMQNILILEICSMPFISLILIEKYQDIKLSEIISNIFLPLLLISVTIFGGFSLFSQVKPYQNRDIFIIYNTILILFTILLIVAQKNNNNKFINICIYVSPVILILLDIMTLSATIYRISNYGLTPNKLTLLITNITILVNIVIVFIQNIYNKKNKTNTHQSLHLLLSYSLLSFVVVFVFPFVFKFK